MRKKTVWCLALVAVCIVGSGFLADYCGLSTGCYFFAQPEKRAGKREGIKLPPPKRKGHLSVEEAIFRRRSIRAYGDEPLTLEEVSQLLWAAGGKTVDGVTGATRAYPSAGGLHPLEFYLVAGNVDGLADGVYHYDWRAHSLTPVREGDVRGELTKAAWGQGMMAKAPASIVFTAVYPRTTGRYRKRGETRYVPMDAGGAGQNVHLQAESLGLSTVILGAFQDEAVNEALGVKGETPLYIMPVGRK